jgi:hypothetical protein
VPDWAPFCYLAAAAVVIAAAVIAASVTAQHIAAAVAEQEDQDDDPANITAAETVIVTHINYLRKNLQRHLPLIPRYSGAGIWCEKYRRGFPLRFSYYKALAHGQHMISCVKGGWISS